MAAAQPAQPAACNYQPFPSMFDASSGQCAPRLVPGQTGPLTYAQAQNVPLGMGVPTAMPPPTMRSAAPIQGVLPPGMVPAQAPIASDVAKQYYTQQQQLVAANMQFAAPKVDPVACNQQQMVVDTAGSQLSAEDIQKNTIKADLNLLGHLVDFVKTRRYAFHLNFSLFEAASNSNCVKFRVSSDSPIFQLKGLGADGHSRGGQLKTAIVVGGRLLYGHSTCEVPLGVRISGVRGNTYGGHGVRCAFPLFPHKSHKYGKQGLMIHRITDMLDVRNLDRYGHMTLASVKKTVLFIETETFSFVEITSPIMDVIEANEKTLRLKLQDFATVKNKYYIVSNDVVQAVLAMMDREFFQRMPFTDLNNFEVSLVRLDGKKWDNTDGLQEFQDKSGRIVEDHLLRRNFVGVWLELDYLLHRGPTPQVVHSDAQIAGAPGAMAPVNSTGF